MSDSKKNSYVFMYITGAKKSSVVGGGIAFQEVIAQQLVQEGFEVFAISNPADELGFSFLQNNKFIANYKIADPSARTWFLFNVKKLWSELRRITTLIPDDAIYVTVDPFPPDIIAAYFLRMKLKKKVIITMHHITPSPLFHPFNRGLVRSNISWLMSIFALITIKVSSIPVFLDNFRILEVSGWRLGNLVMEMPSSIGNFRSLTPNNVGHTACFIGRLNKNKGVADLIQAWRIVTKHLPNATLYLIGKDFSNGKYHRMIQRYRMSSNVKITGYVEDTEKERLLRDSVIFPFPSYEEGWSLSVMEAIDNGLLPVLYDLPAYDYVCNDDLKIKPGDINAFAARIVYYMENKEERISTIKELQTCNQKYTKEYVFEVWLDQIHRKFKL